MVLNTLTVGAAVTPTVVKTYATHYTNRKTRRQRPTAHISYDEGLNLIRQFLIHASHHTVEEVQAFTSQWVPNPRWVRAEDITIPEENRKESAHAIIAQLGDKGVNQVGGKEWWQWTRDNKPLVAEWIEMRAEHHRRKKAGEKCQRVMLYVHGGAYFFGSVDEHRYQMQRHARKLRARVFAPRYRLSPQYPFPCGLQDCLAAYLYLLTIQDPTEIILSGDSAGGGMVLSMLVVLRDQGLPLPAGAILISPWVDLTHSFPSVAGDNKFDYIPPHGFMQRPSLAWPPPNADDMEAINRNAIETIADAEIPRKSTQQERETNRQSAIQGFSVSSRPYIDPEANPNNPATEDKHPKETPGNTIPGPGHNLSIVIEGKLVEIKDQIQMYAHNAIISHPLVSPVMQASLGGLPPLLILTGGGEMLRDEQIYVAHKAANPAKYPPGEAYFDDHPEARENLKKYKPTNVQLQVWDDLCHVAPTLSFTRPAKYMYRSIAQFGAWALAKAQKTEIEILDDDDVSIISTGSDTDTEEEDKEHAKAASGPSNGSRTGVRSSEQVGKAGDPLPPFKNHMVRQRVDRHGVIYSLDPPETLPALQMDPDHVGIIKEGPVSKWMKAKATWDSKYATQKRKIQKQRAKEIAQGYQSFGSDEVPPPSALAGRRGAAMPKEAKTKRSLGMSLWSLWGSSHDKTALDKEEEMDKNPEQEPEVAVATPAQGKPTNGNKSTRPAWSRSRSRHRNVAYEGQADGADDIPDIPTAAAQKHSSANPTFVPLPTSPEVADSPSSPGGAPLVLTGTNITLDHPQATRPKADGIAFPFKLGKPMGDHLGDNASIMTLESHRIATPGLEAGSEKMLGSSRSNAVSTVGPDDPTSGMTSTGDGTLSKERPEPERFETAQEDLPTVNGR